MNIKNQIRLSIFISLILVVAISASIVVSYVNMQDLRDQESLAADVVRGGYELTYLSNDYLINAEPRARLQWEERYASLQPIISQLKPGNKEETQSLESIREYNEKTGDLFREIPDPGDLSPGAVLFPASYQQVMWSRMNVQSQGMIFEAWRLRHSYNDDVSEARYWNNILVIALMLAMLVIITVNYLLISRRLVRSIREVNAGSRAFAAGNLDYRIPLQGTDEIGNIGAGLNAMAAHLETITASRDELDREVDRRRQAEEALKSKNIDLEAMYEAIRVTDEDLAANYEELDRNQRALAESERKYRNLYQYAQVGLFETSFKDATVIACNERYATLAGFSSVEEAIGRDILHLYANPDDRTEVSRILREHGHIENYLLKLRNHATGKIFLAQFSARFNYEKEIAEGSIIDITAQKEAETEVQDSKNFLDRIIEQSPNPIWISDEKGTLLRINKACCDVLHITPGEVIGKYNVLEDSIVEAQGKMPLVRSVFEEGNSVNFDLEYDSKLLTSIALERYAKVFLNVTIFPIRDSAGRITNAVIQHLDFTERKKAEVALRETNEYLKNLLDYANAPIIVWDPEFRITRFNHAFEDLTGRTEQEVIGQHLSLLFPETSRDASLELIRKTLTGERWETVEIPIKHISGKTCTVLWNSANIVDSKGTIISTIAQGQDITERKRAEAELVVAQQRYRELFESVSIGILRSTPGPQGTLIEANPAALRIFEADSREQFLAVRPSDLYLNHEQRRKISDEILASGAIREMEVRYKTLKGRAFWGRISATKKISKDGRVYFDNTIEDITGRKEAEEALQQSEEKYRLLFARMIEGSALHEIVYDSAGNPAEYRILDVNPAFERITGLKREAVIGKTSREVYGVDTPPYFDVYSRVADTGQSEAFNVYFAPMKKHFTISAYSTRKGRFATIFEDITDRKLAEAQREALIKELEQKNAELERFTYTISHDLKSPLITIKGFASLLEDDTRTGDPLLLKKDIHRIMEAAETMQALLVDVLELARVGKIVSPLEKIPFLKIAREAVDLLAGPLAERGVTVEIAPDLPDVNVDHARIREVMTNLIENAVKFFGDQEKPLIRIGVDRQGEIPVFFVQDNGIGIDPRYLERIFNLFEKLDASAPGTGVGLTIVRRIIEVHGGKIWAESEGPGKGTTFRFTLPVPGVQ